MQNELQGNWKISDQLKVSVIVPVYNSEKYLRQCLDSICAQTLRDIEIICVDDGSTDASFDILEEYRQHDKRISVYQQPNRTAGAARNLGKAHARGEYLVFWDSDDYFDLNALESMYRKAAEYCADICVCGAGKYFEELKKSVPQLKSYMDKKKTPNQEVFNIHTNWDGILSFTSVAPWNKMFRRDFIEKCGLDFQEIRIGNDIYFVACALCMADKIVTLEQSLITYRVHLKDNLTGSISKNPLSALRAWESVAYTLKEYDLFPEKSFANRALRNIVYMLRNIKEYEAFKEAVEYLKAGTLDELCLRPYDDNYYEMSWYNDILRSLREDSVEKFLMNIAYVSYTQQMEASAKKQLADRDIKKKNSQMQEMVCEIHQLEEENEKLKSDLQQSIEEKTELEMKYKTETDKYKNNNMELKKQIQEERKKSISEKEELEKQLKTTQKKLGRVQEYLTKTRKSLSLRMGRMITWLPRKVRDIIE